MTSTAAGEAVNDAADAARGDTGPGERSEPARHHPHAVHRLRDLDRRGRVWAVAVAVSLLLAPLAALATFLPDWTPANDPALMGLRSLDVGTLRTPTVGQPSQSGLYADTASPVHHPGPLHFYLMALPIRVLGGAVAMPLVSAAINGGCLMVAAWAVFRQLGRSAGIVAALALSAVAFTTGASSFVNPVSSHIAGYPLLLCAVLAWCVGAGDIRLLPLTAAVASFTAQQHLAVVPATVVLVAGGLALLAVRWWRDGRRHDRDSRRALARQARRAGVVSLALWAPVLAQQAFGQQGNLGEMLWFARHGNRETLGYGSAVQQVANTLGLPPLLGRTDLTGSWLLADPSASTWGSAAAVLGGVAGLGLWWARANEPRRASLVAMAGAVMLAGLVNGASVPAGLEQGRISFYHWAFVLSFFVALILGLALVEAVGRYLPGRTHAVSAARPAMAGLAVALVALPALVGPRLDRWTNTPSAAYSPVDHASVAALADAVETHDDRMGEHVLLVSRHEPVFAGIAAALSFELAQRGIDVKHDLTDRYFVHDDRLVDRDLLDGGLVLVVDRVTPGDAPPGDLVADVAVGTAADLAPYRALVAAAEDAGEVRLGSGAEQAVDGLAADDQALVRAVLAELADDPAAALQRPLLLDFLHDHPVELPAFDPDDVETTLETFAGLDGGDLARRVAGLRLYLLDENEMADYAFTHELGSRDGT